MKKRYITSLLILMLTIPACAQTPDPVNFGPDFKLLGKLKPRTTQEIAGSDLWIGGEVLDRDYADYHGVLDLGRKNTFDSQATFKTIILYANERYYLYCT